MLTDFLHIPDLTIKLYVLYELFSLRQPKVYVARTDHREDESKALEIEKYLGDHSIDKILCDIPGQFFSQKILFAAQKCRWFVILLT
jgi:hypothetical protein